MFWNRMGLLIKNEVSYNTDPVPTVAVNGVLAKNVELLPMEGQDINRDFERPNFQSEEEIAAGLHMKLTFDVELVGSGAPGTPPPMAPMLRACGMAETITAGTKVEYTPITDGAESAGIYFGRDTSRFVMLGSRCDATIKLSAQDIPTVSFALTGLFTAPAAGTVLVPVLTSWLTGVVASKANTPVFTIGGSPFVMRSYEFALGNQIEPRLLIGDESIRIVDRSAERVKVGVEAKPLGTYNPYQIALDRTKQAVVLQHGTEAGNIVTLDHFNCQQRRPAAPKNMQGIVEQDLEFIPLPTSAAGNNQWKLTFT